MKNLALGMAAFVIGLLAIAGVTHLTGLRCAPDGKFHIEGSVIECSDGYSYTRDE